MNWRIPFNIKNTGRSCYVDISSGAGRRVILQGDVPPVTINEDDDSNVMKAVRTSSGNISIIATSDPSAIFATDTFSHRVTITNELDVVWEGYIQPSNNDMAWTAFPINVQLPIVSCLGALADVEMPATDDKQFGVLRLRDFIHKAFVASGTRATTFIFPNEWNINILDSKLQEYAFYEESGINPDSPDYKRYVGITYLDMLERIMTTLGWTMYERGSTIVAVSRTCETYKSVNIANMEDASPAYTTVTPDTQSLPDLASSEHNQSMIPACDTINIEATAEGTDDINVQFSPDNPFVHLGDEVELQAGHGIESLLTMKFEGYRMDVDAKNCDIIPHEYQITYYKEFDDDPIAVDSIDEIQQPLPFDEFMSMADGADDGERTRYTHFGAQMYHADIWPTSTTGKKKYDFKDFVAIVVSTAYDNVQSKYVGLTEAQLKAHPVLSIRTKRPIHFTNGVICINTDFVQSLHDFAAIWMRVKIGDMYYAKPSPSSTGYWTEQESWMSVTLREDDKTSYTKFKEYNEATGVIIPTYFTQLSGIIEIDIAPNIAEVGHFVGSLSSFDVKTMLPDLYGGVGRTNGNSYYASSNMGNGKSVDVSLSIITMADNLPCKNCLWWNDAYLTTQFEYLGTPMRPEAALATKYKSQLGNARHLLHVICEYTEIMPNDSVTVGSDTYIVLAASHDYYENKTTLTLLSYD